MPVNGTFKPGDFVPVTVGFGRGEKVTLKIPVVLDDGYYEGLDISGGATGAEDGAADTTTE